MKYKNQIGLGGEMEGHSVENGGYCDSGAEYEANAVVQLDHLGMSQEYISTFKPTSYAKTWIRYVPMIYEEFGKQSYES